MLELEAGEGKRKENEGESTSRLRGKGRGEQMRKAMTETHINPSQLTGPEKEQKKNRQMK